MHARSGGSKTSSTKRVLEVKNWESLPKRQSRQARPLLVARQTEAHDRTLTRRTPAPPRAYKDHTQTKSSALAPRDQSPDLCFRVWPISAPTDYTCRRSNEAHMRAVSVEPISGRRRRRGSVSFLDVQGQVAHGFSIAARDNCYGSPSASIGLGAPQFLCCSDADSIAPRCTQRHRG